jgi:hypothetical protein
MDLRASCERMFGSVREIAVSAGGEGLRRDNGKNGSWSYSKWDKAYIAAPSVEDPTYGDWFPEEQHTNHTSQLYMLNLGYSNTGGKVTAFYESRTFRYY